MAPSVVGVAVVLGRDPLVRVDGIREAALDRPRSAVTARGLRGEHDLERVVGVLRPRHSRPARLDAVDEVA
jgi:hypothetical protein